MRHEWTGREANGDLVFLAVDSSGHWFRNQGDASWRPANPAIWHFPEEFLRLVEENRTVKGTVGFEREHRKIDNEINEKLLGERDARIAALEAEVERLRGERRELRRRFIQDVGVIPFDDWRDAAAVRKVIDWILPEDHPQPPAC